MKKWYDYSEEERIKKVYSKYTIKEYWEWWSDKQTKFMEVRIKDYQLVKQLAAKHKLQYSTSGVYVTDANQLKSIIATVRDKATVWASINPRKKNWGSKGWKTFGCGRRGGSSDDNIEAISFIFIDIDRKTKIKPANSKELEACDIMANKIIERMNMNKWAEAYTKIASGNGVQLLFKLDIPIKIPTRIYNKEKQYFEHSEEFEALKVVIKDGIGASIRRFSKRFEDDLMVDVDASAFNINRVGALPVTKNYKYDSFQWRGVVELKNGSNDGLSDYIMSKMTDLKTFKSKNTFVKMKVMPSDKHIIRPGKLRENRMIKFLMEYDFQKNGWLDHLNDKFWFQVKALLRDSKFDMNSKEFRKFHSELESRYKGRFTLNLPENKYDFNLDTVNNFCIDNGVEPLYPLWEKRTVRKEMGLQDMKWGIQALRVPVMELDSITGITEDMKNVKDILTAGDYNNIRIIASFIKGCIKKYGEDRTKYFVENLFDKYFNYF